jgi:hypothetical protein
VLWALALLAIAQPSEGDFPLESKLRAGILIGTPLSISIATDLAEGLVLQLDLGVSPSESFSGVLGMDVVYRAEQIFGRVYGDLWLMPWFGIGIRGAVAEGERTDRYGFRVPFGISVLSELEPVEVYLQTAIGLSLFPERRASIDAGAGIRVGL